MRKEILFGMASLVILSMMSAANASVISYRFSFTDFIGLTPALNTLPTRESILIEYRLDTSNSLNYQTHSGAHHSSMGSLAYPTGTVTIGSSKVTGSRLDVYLTDQVHYERHWFSLTDIDTQAKIFDRSIKRVDLFLGHTKNSSAVQTPILPLSSYSVDPFAGFFLYVELLPLPTDGLHYLVYGTSALGVIPSSLTINIENVVSEPPAACIFLICIAAMLSLRAPRQCHSTLRPYNEKPA